MKTTLNMNQVRRVALPLVVLAAFICFGVLSLSLQHHKVDEKFRAEIDKKIIVAQQQATAKVAYQATASAAYDQALQLTPVPPPNYPKRIKHGLYEVTLTWTNKTEPNSYFVEKTDFVWVRLYKNGTYRTSQSTKGKIEGRYFYNPKTGKITFKNPYREEDALERIVGGHFIYNYLQADYDEKYGIQFSWSVETISHTHGSIVCQWKNINFTG